MPGLLLQAIVVIAIAGVGLWALTQFPIDATLVKIIRVIVIVIVAVWAISVVASLFGGPSYSVFGPYPPRR